MIEFKFWANFGIREFVERRFETSKLRQISTSSFANFRILVLDEIVMFEEEDDDVLTDNDDVDVLIFDALLLPEIEWIRVDFIGVETEIATPPLLQPARCGDDVTDVIVDDEVTVAGNFLVVSVSEDLVDLEGLEAVNEDSLLFIIGRGGF